MLNKSISLCVSKNASDLETCPPLISLQALNLTFHYTVFALDIVNLYLAISQQYICFHAKPQVCKGVIMFEVLSAR